VRRRLHVSMARNRPINETSQSILEGSRYLDRHQSELDRLHNVFENLTRLSCRWRRGVFYGNLLRKFLGELCRDFGAGFCSQTFPFQNELRSMVFLRLHVDTARKVLKVYQSRKKTAIDVAFGA
jgi:hypothetical protein